MEVDGEMIEEKKRVGILNEVNGYVVKIIIDKEEVPNPIYPLETPMPIYVVDEKDILYLIYEQDLIAPTADLPTLNIVQDEQIIVLNPAKQFILQSALSNFLGSAVIVSIHSVPELLGDVWILPSESLEDYWKKFSFDHLRLVQDLLKSEKFKIFMQVFMKLYGAVIIGNDGLRKKLLEILVEIGDKANLNNSADYLELLKGFMADESVALILDNKSKIIALLKSDELRYGDLICFKVNSQQTLAVISEVHLTAKLDLLLAIEDGIPTTFISSLPMGLEGEKNGVKEIISKLYDRFDEKFIQIPIGIIPKTDLEYKIILKGNELIHVAFIAISGSGKGNSLKEMCYECLKAQVIFRKNNPSKVQNNGLGIILFDDVGEYVKCLKPYDWGLNVGAMVLKLLFNSEPLIHFIDVAMRVDTSQDDDTGYEFMHVRPMKVPLEYIPLIEVVRSLENEVAYHVIPALMREFYTSFPDLRPSFLDDRLTIEFVNWFLDLAEDSGRWRTDNRDCHGFRRDSYYAARRALKEFLLSNHTYLGLNFDWESDHFHYFGDLIDKKEKNREKMQDQYNLINLAERCADKSEILIIDESSLDSSIKLLVQRILLNHIVELRELRGFDPDIRPCLFIIEEATALMSGKESKQLELFHKVQVRARKYGIGIGLVLQDINRLDPGLLTQLGWMIAMGLPVDSMRQLLFRSVPADMGPYDDFLKRADVGIAVGFQKLIGKNLPLPVQINHYEEMVRKDLWDEQLWGDETGFDQESQDNFKGKAKELGIPQDVINLILKWDEKIG
jgi:hypothetical protein